MLRPGSEGQPSRGRRGGGRRKGTGFHREPPKGHHHTSPERSSKKALLASKPVAGQDCILRWICLRRSRKERLSSRRWFSPSKACLAASVLAEDDLTGKRSAEPSTFQLRMLSGILLPFRPWHRWANHRTGRCLSLSHRCTDHEQSCGAGVV